MGGAEDADVDRTSLRLADAADLALLQHAKELRLERERHLSDLVEEERPAVRFAEEAGRRRDRSGERAANVFEELGLEQLRREGCDVDRDERRRPPRAVRVEQAREDLLAGPGLPLDDDARGGPRDHSGLLHQRVERRALGDHERAATDAVDRVRAPAAAAQGGPLHRLHARADDREVDRAARPFHVFHYETSRRASQPKSSGPGAWLTGCVLAGRRTGMTDIESHADCRALVDAFYARARRDPLLGPVFESRIAGRWEEHLERMTRFWATVLFAAPLYAGRPLEQHAPLPIGPDHFARWLALWHDEVDQRFAGGRAEHAKRAAVKMSLRLGLAREGLRASG